MIEVVFAIGVILIGLVGLTAILPLAGHRAQDSLDFDAGASIAEAVVRIVDSRQLLRANALRAIDGNALTVGSNVPPFCFDPMAAATLPASTFASYDRSFFPFYNSNHDPLLDPALASSLTTAGFAGQPRMRRAGLVFPSTITTDVQRLELSRTLVESSDDLTQFRPRDRSKPPVLTGLRSVQGGLAYGTSVSSGVYQWFLTVDPDEESRYASMSVVICRSRDFAETFPAAAVDTPNGNAVSERVALVAPQYSPSPPLSPFAPIGFRGGAGGTVVLLSAGNTVSRLTSNDWIMLSRTVDPSDPIRTQVHRWYRVVSVDREATLVTPNNNSEIELSAGLTITVPSSTGRGSTSVWAHTVLLDGPDWEFEAPVSSGATSNSLTYATIVNDVVSVKTTTISLSDF